MKLPDQIINFIEGKIEMTNMLLPSNYPSIDKFHEFQAGYRFNGNTLEKLAGKIGQFGENWFVICSNYFNDPFFVDITETENNYPVYYAKHGLGVWIPIKISKSLIQFINQLEELKKLENNRNLLLNKLKNEFNLKNELWEEVYESILEEEDF